MGVMSAHAVFLRLNPEEEPIMTPIKLTETRPAIEMFETRTPDVLSLPLEVQHDRTEKEYKVWVKQEYLKYCALRDRGVHDAKLPAEITLREGEPCTDGKRIFTAEEWKPIFIEAMQRHCAYLRQKDQEWCGEADEYDEDDEA